MRIAMVYPRGVPPVRGGAERLWESIVREINARTDHHAELLGVDAPEHSFAQLVASYTAFDALDVSAFDLVITGKYPAWMVRHPRHVVYVAHPLRGLYEQYGGPTAVSVATLNPISRRLFETLLLHPPGRPLGRQTVLERAADVVAELPDAHPDLVFPGPLVRRLVQWLDRDALDSANIAAHLAISGTVANRPGYFPGGVGVEVVIPPSGLEGLRCAPGGGSLFTASRLDRPKRIDLLIHAMAHVDADIQLRIAGVGPEEADLRSLAANDSRITFLGHLTDEKLAEEYAAAVAVPFVPLDEDLGLITLEAQMCCKPVVTCVDSGGPTELVENGVTGFVVPPEPAAVGHALQRLVESRELAATFGERGRERAAQITWDLVLGPLLRPRPSSPPRARRPTIVALSTYPAAPPRHGGQVRLNRLLRALAAHADVHLLAMDSSDTELALVDGGFLQATATPDSGYHYLNSELSREVGIPTGDIAATLKWRELGNLSRLAADAVASADATVLAHPYLYPLARRMNAKCIVYDAHNVESQLKRSMYAANEIGSALADSVNHVETAVLRAADLVTAVSPTDLDALREMAGVTMAQFHVIPNGGNVADRPFVTGVARAQARNLFVAALGEHGINGSFDSVAVFVGSGHPPNVVAAERIVGAAAHLPRTLFVLVGSHTRFLPGSPTHPNVMSRGEVNELELARLLSSCDVALNPMDVGAGTNLKMLDYFATGAPVVATEVGARGLGAVAGVHYASCGVDDLASTISTTIADPAGGETRALAARDLATSYDWPLLGERFANLVLEAVARN